MDKDIFNTLIFIARPAAGKSEIIDFLLKCDPHNRREIFHIGEMRVLDDFPMLWAWFEEDALLARMGQKRIHTDTEGYFIGSHMWDLLIERLCLEYEKLYKLTNDNQTIIFEFSRGSEHGGYQRAFEHISEKVLQSGLGIIYINVSWEESLRKNRKRFNPNQPDSILEHSLPDNKLAKLYSDTDWVEISSNNPTHISIKGVHVPYVEFPNEDDVTSEMGEALGNRLREVLDKLWSLYKG